MHEDVSLAWERAVEQWDDIARHDALLALVVQHSEFAWAAARYKERGDDAIATARLERLRRAATATMFASASRARETDEASPYKKIMIWIVVLVVMLVLGLVFARIVVSNAPRKATPARHPTPARH